MRPTPAVRIAVVAAAAVASRAAAGPPSATDDPEPVEFRHWEVYLASHAQGSGGDGWTAALAVGSVLLLIGFRWNSVWLLLLGAAAGLLLGTPPV